MAKTFNKMVDLVERIPDINTTQYMFWSLLAKLHKEDQEKVVEYLMDCVTEQPVQQEDGK
jgi:hypothetical protein